MPTNGIEHWLRSSAIHPEDERHPHVIKDFISSLQHNIRNKIANKWTDLKNPPCTVQEAFDLTIKTETQIQVADSFKMELTSNFASADINEISTDDTSFDEFEINEVSKGKKWNNNNYKERWIQMQLKYTAATTDTTKKSRIISQVISGNTRRGLQDHSPT